MTHLGAVAFPVRSGSSRPDSVGDRVALEKKSRPMVVVSDSPFAVLREALDIVGPHAIQAR